MLKKGKEGKRRKKKEKEGKRRKKKVSQGEQNAMNAALKQLMRFQRTRCGQNLPSPGLWTVDSRVRTVDS